MILLARIRINHHPFLQMKLPVGSTVESLTNGALLDHSPFCQEICKLILSYLFSPAGRCPPHVPLPLSSHPPRPLQGAKIGDRVGVWGGHSPTWRITMENKNLNTIRMGSVVGEADADDDYFVLVNFESIDYRGYSGDSDHSTHILVTPFAGSWLSDWWSYVNFLCMIRNGFICPLTNNCTTVTAAVDGKHFVFTGEDDIVNEMSMGKGRKFKDKGTYDHYENSLVVEPDNSFTLISKKIYCYNQGPRLSYQHFQLRQAQGLSPSLYDRRKLSTGGLYDLRLERVD